jgi:hypothetical protein
MRASRKRWASASVNWGYTPEPERHQHLVDVAHQEVKVDVPDGQRDAVGERGRAIRVSVISDPAS